jgi:transcriptional regulator with AAA-type ATPase domain
LKTLIYTAIQRHVQKYVEREFRHGKRFMQPEPVKTDDQDGAFDPLDQAENRRVKLQTKRWTTDDILEFIDNEDSRALCRLVIECDGNLSKTASRLGISEGTVRYRLRMLAPKLLARGFNPFKTEDSG